MTTTIIISIISLIFGFCLGCKFTIDMLLRTGKTVIDKSGEKILFVVRKVTDRTYRKYKQRSKP